MQFGLTHLLEGDTAALVARTRAFYARRGARRGPSSHAELLEARSRVPTPAPSEPPAVLELAEGATGAVPLRIHAPLRGPAAGVLLDIHGGGFVLGSAASDDVRHRRLADALGIAVVSVEHRLAPEHPWPAAPDDCEVAARWLVDQAERRFGTRRLAIGGFSSGATLATTTLLRLRDRGIAAFGAAVLQFGTYDLSGRTPAGRSIVDEHFLGAYAGAAADRTDPDLSPVFGDLAGLPPVLVVIGADDVLLEDNLAMAVRLSAAGVEVDLRVYPASPHGFTGHPTPMAQAALDGIESWLGRRLAGPVEPGRGAPLRRS
jgi:acetyl esterase/lipase